MRLTGKITQWQDARGFGFIQPTLGGEAVFVHISEIAGSQRPVGGEPVTFELRRDAKGRRQATKVQLATQGTPRRAAARSKASPWLVAGSFLIGVTAVAATGRLPLYVPLLYAFLSIITYLVYGLDKWSAQRHGSRTPEKTLLMLGLAGGWPGALVAQQTLRHKSSKQSFLVPFWFSVILNCAALAWLILNPQMLA